MPSLRRLRRVAPSRSDSTESTRRRGGSSAVATSALSTSLAAPHCTTATLVGSPTLKHSVSNGLQHLARSGPGRPLNQPKARTCTVSTKTPQIQNIPRPPPLIRRLRPGGLSRPCHRRPSAANKGHEIAAVRPAQPGRPGCDQTPDSPAYAERRLYPDRLVMIFAGPARCTCQRRRRQRLARWPERARWMRAAPRTRRATRAKGAEAVHTAAGPQDRRAIPVRSDPAGGAGGGAGQQYLTQVQALQSCARSPVLRSCRSSSSACHPQARVRGKACSSMAGTPRW